ncbi:MAG: helix-turn-helix domain-containing protein [Oscillospiraceae bacterium]
MYDFGQLLRDMRKKKRMTQKQLADKLGVTEATVSRYESNTATPPLDTLRSISAIMNVSLDELLGTEQHFTVSVFGLTEQQNEIIRSLISSFRELNSQTLPTISEENYALLGKISAELTK